MRKIALWITLGLLAGCGSLPTIRLEQSREAIAKVESKQAGERASEIVYGSEFVYAANYALQKDAVQSREVGIEMTARAEAILGTPDLDQSLKMRRMVDEMLSADAAIRKQGDKDLAAMDAKLSSLTREKELLQSELQHAQARQSSLENDLAKKADKQAAEDANWWNPIPQIETLFKKFFILGAICLAVAIGLPMLAAAFPVLAPVVMGIGALIGKLLGWFLGKIPGAVDGAGVIAKDAYDALDGMKNRLVSGIENFKAHQTGAGNTAPVQTLKDYLSKSLNSDDKAIIQKAKDGTS